MNTCPLEVHAYIFGLACTDDGRTGRALSSVSRYVRHVSAAYHWQNLVISGIAQAKGFAALLDSLPVAGTPTDNTSIYAKRPILHLFVSNRDGAAARDMRLQQRCAASTAEGRQRVGSAFDLEADQWGAAIRRILTYAADSVRTLTMMCYDIHISASGRLFFSDLKRTDFPRLVDLTIRGGFDIKMRDYPDTSDHPLSLGIDVSENGEGSSRLTAYPTLPSLRCLHLISPISFELFLQRLYPLAPNIRCIRLSELTAFDYELCRLLFSELAERQIVSCRLHGLHDKQWSTEPVACPVEWAPYLPSSEILERLILQPSRLPPEPQRQCGCCSGYYKIDDMTRMLKEMARESLGDMFVYLPPGKRRGLGYPYDEAKADWESRAAGGIGCWKERKDIDLDVVEGEADVEDDWEHSGLDVSPRRPRRSFLRFLMESP